MFAVVLFSSHLFVVDLSPPEGAPFLYIAANLKDVEDAIRAFSLDEKCKLLSD